MRVADAPRILNGNMNGYTDPLWGQPKRWRTGSDVSQLLPILGWAEPCRGGWVAFARGDTGAVHRSACVRGCQREAINVAQSMARALREEQRRVRCAGRAGDEGDDE